MYFMLGMRIACEFDRPKHDGGRRHGTERITSMLQRVTSGSRRATLSLL